MVRVGRTIMSPGTIARQRAGTSPWTQGYPASYGRFITSSHRRAPPGLQERWRSVRNISVGYHGMLSVQSTLSPSDILYLQSRAVAFVETLASCLGSPVHWIVSNRYDCVSRLSAHALVDDDHYPARWAAARNYVIENLPVWFPGPPVSRRRRRYRRGFLRRIFGV